MNKEYWQAKVILCERTAISQILAGDIAEGNKNIKRMVRAMEELNLIKANEGESDE